MSTRPLTVPRDGNVIGVALAAAVLLHGAALLLPVRWSLPEAPAPPPEPDPPRIVTPILDPPPLSARTPPPARPIPAMHELLPPPREADLGPVEDGVPAIEAAAAPASAPWLPGDPAPPPAPAIVDESTANLRLPEPLGGRTPPDYPESARRMRLGGKVLLSAVITAEGRVDRVEVLSAPDPDLGFSAAAMEAVRTWRYLPGTLGGRPVAVRLTVIVDFTLH